MSSFFRLLFFLDPVARFDSSFLIAFYPGIDLLAYNRLQENWLGAQPMAQELVVLLGEEAAKLRQAAQDIFSFVCPEAPVPETMAQLAAKVGEVPAAGSSGAGWSGDGPGADAFLVQGCSCREDRWGLPCRS